MEWMFHTEACRDTLAPKWRVERHLDTGRVSGARGFCSLWERLHEPWDTFGGVFPSLRCPGVQVGTGDGPEISPYCEQLSLTALHGESSAYESTSMSKDGGILHTMHVIGSMIQRCHPVENGAAKRPATL